MSLWIYAAGFAGMAAIGMFAAVALTRGQPIRRQPAAEVEPRAGEFGADSLFAGELHAIRVDLAGANYEPRRLRCGDSDEPQPDAEQPTDPEVEQPSPDDPAWWRVPPALDERTPEFSAPGRHRYPDPLELETFTQSWARAALREWLDMDEEEAA